MGPAAVSRFVLHRLATLGPAASELARTVAVLGDDCELRLASPRVGVERRGVPRGGRRPRPRRHPRSRGRTSGSSIRSSALRSTRTSGRASARRGTRPRPRRWRRTAPRPSALPRTCCSRIRRATPGGWRSCRTAAASAARHGAPGAAAVRLRRALAERPGPQERAEILTDLGKSEVAAGSFEAAEEHLREALASDAGVTLRVGAATALARCGMLSGGSSAEAAVAAMSAIADELESLDPERSLVVRSELLILATIVPSVRHALPEQRRRFRDLARGDGGFEAVARLHDARERQIRGESAADVASEVEQALAAGLPASAGRNSVVMALIILRFAERYDLAHRMLDMGLEVARAEGHATRQGIIYALRATIALERGSLRDAQVDAETGLQLVEEPHFSVGQLLAVLITVHVERGELDVADELARRGDASGVTEDRMFLDEYLIARARLRIAQGDAARGAADLQWCGERLKALGLEWQTHWRAVAAPALASLGEKDAAVRLADEQLALARRVGSPRALGLSLRARALIDDGDRRLGGLEEAVAVLEPSAGRLELARTLADLGAELGRANRRREGREASRRAMQLAGECGATALAERARADLQSGPGRRAPVELTGPGALTAAEWRVCRQVAEGHTNREVAQAIFITEKTVERHLSSIFQKLGIRSRHQLREAIGEQKQ